MPTLTWQQATQLDHGWTKELIELLAILVSNQNPDGSQFSLGVTLSGVQTLQTESFIVGVPSGVIANVNASGGLIVDGSAVTQPVSLPAGQAVELLDSGGTNKASISAAGAVKVDGSAVTQPVSGTVAVSNLPATQPVSGTVAVSNLPATQTVAGSVTATPSFPEEVVLEGILRELRRISLLLSIMGGVEVTDSDLGETER